MSKINTQVKKYIASNIKLFLKIKTNNKLSEKIK